MAIDDRIPTTEELAARDCIPCKGGVPPLDAAAVAGFLPSLPGWTAPGDHHLHREYRFKDFVAALAFVNLVGATAERQNHHPDLGLGWGRVSIDLWTHKIDGLTESDFVLAAKIDRLFDRFPA